jgi:hypothetical protein
MEAAPADTGIQIWAPNVDRSYEYPNPGETIRWGKLITTALGRGKENTEEIMVTLNQQGGGFGWAIRVVSELNINGFNDWFLPSRDELNFMYGNLYLKELGNFRSGLYWTSSLGSDGQGYVRNIHAIDFSTGKSAEYSFVRHNDQRGSIRAARRF